MHRIGVIPGDGIGPEVAGEGLKVLKRVAEIENINYDLTTYPFSGAHYLATGELLPESALTEFRQEGFVGVRWLGHGRLYIYIRIHGVMPDLNHNARDD